MLYETSSKYLITFDDSFIFRYFFRLISDENVDLFMWKNILKSLLVLFLMNKNYRKNILPAPQLFLNKSFQLIISKHLRSVFNIHILRGFLLNTDEFE